MKKELTILTPVCLFANQQVSTDKTDYILSLKYLKKCLFSISNQTIHRNTDWVINHLLILNGKGKEFLKDFINSNKCEYKQNIFIEEYTGDKFYPSLIRNWGLKHHSVIGAELIMILDSDDFLPEVRIENVINAFKLDESIGAVSSNFRFVDSDGQNLTFSLDLFTSNLLNPNYSITNNGWKTLFLFEKARWYNLCGYCVKKDLLIDVGFKNIYTSEDIWLHSQILSKFQTKIYLLQNSSNWGFYRIHKNQFSAGIKLSYDFDYIKISINTAREALHYLLNSKLRQDIISSETRNQLLASWEINTCVRQYVLFNKKDDKKKTTFLTARIIHESLNNAQNLLETSRLKRKIPVATQMIIDKEFPQLNNLLNRNCNAPLEELVHILNTKS